MGSAIDSIEAARARLASQAVERYTRANEVPVAPWAVHVAAVGELVPLLLGFVLADELATSFGVDPGSIHVVRQLCLVAAVVGALVAVPLLHGRPRRALAQGVSMLVGGGTLVAAGVSTTLPVTAVAIAVAALAMGTARTARHALAGDVGSPVARPASAAVDRAVVLLGAAGAAALVGSSPGGWRGAVVGSGVAVLAVGVWCGRVRDVGYGTADARLVRGLVNEAATASAPVDEMLPLSPGEGFRRVLAAPHVRLCGLGVLAVGSTVGPGLQFSLEILRDRHHVVASDRSIALAAVCTLAAVATIAMSRWSWPRRDVALIAVAATSLIGVALAPAPVLLVVALACALACLATVEGCLVAAALASAEPMLRPHVAGLLGAAWFAGAAQALQFTGSIESRYGPGTALVLLGISLVPVLGLVATARRRAAERAGVVAGDLVEDQQLRVLASAGEDLPLLACRHLDFGYSGLQVLFDVSFNVDEGEMVALLGTNGAGKSTLLRAISGLGRPTAGCVRFAGHDITGFDAPRRVGIGIVQIPGGKARFPTMTVADNLRAYGFALGRDRRVLESRIDIVLDTFPRLAERRNEPSATLSGGEAQMLALGKALLLQPRLLLIDELSLGLAPKVVGELLEMVRAINAAGTAVVLVEQSVNIALSLVDHAYFMEKGRVRFDGPADVLLGRDDLLRSVFLEGAGAAS